MTAQCAPRSRGPSPSGGSGDGSSSSSSGGGGDVGGGSVGNGSGSGGISRYNNVQGAGHAHMLAAICCSGRNERKQADTGINAIIAYASISETISSLKLKIAIELHGSLLVQSP